MTKRMVVMSDTHCGSVFGLTPPKYFEACEERRAMQREAWRNYCRLVKKWKGPDVLVVNADCIDGNQHKSGGAELTTPDRNIQCDMAVECIEMWNAKKILMTYGSKYHVSEQAEDFEYLIAQRLGATIGGRLYFDVEGLVCDVRHKIGSSGIPHGRATPLLREMMWDLMKEATECGPKVRMVIRSHVHYHIWIEQPERYMFTTPALQLSRGRYGSRECTGETHWGAIELKINKGKVIGKDVEACRLLANSHPIIKIG